MEFPKCQHFVYNLTVPQKTLSDKKRRKCGIVPHFLPKNIEKMLMDKLNLKRGIFTMKRDIAAEYGLHEESKREGLLIDAKGGMKRRTA